MGFRKHKWFQLYINVISLYSNWSDKQIVLPQNLHHCLINVARTDPPYTQNTQAA